MHVCVSHISLSLVTVTLIKATVRDIFFQKKQPIVKEVLSFISIVNCFEGCSVSSVTLIRRLGLNISGSLRTCIRTVFLEFASGLSGMFGHLYLQMCVDVGTRPAHCE